MTVSLMLVLILDFIKFGILCFFFTIDGARLSLTKLLTPKTILLLLMPCHVSS